MFRNNPLRHLALLFLVLVILGGCTGEPASIPAPESKALLEWLVEEAIDATAKGASIDSVSLEIRSLTAVEIVVEIPAGTHFNSSSSSVQNMVNRHSEVIMLAGGQRTQVTIDAACANMERLVPDESESFTIQAAGENPELELLIALLDEERYPYEVEQAAIWIVTDDANYDDLGTLVGGFGSGSRLIHESDAGQAMQLVANAGISLQGKRIWRNRHRIAEQLDDPDLLAWLEGAEEAGPPEIAGADMTLYHGDGIFNLAFSPDDQQVATQACISGGDMFCANSEVRIWDRKETTVFQELEELLPGRVIDMMWLEEGNALVTASCVEVDVSECFRFESRIWDGVSGEEIGQFAQEIHGGPSTLQISPGARWLVFGHCSNGNNFVDCSAFELRLWDLFTGELAYTLSGFNHWLSPIVFSPDNNQVAVSYFWEDSRLKLYEVHSGAAGPIFEASDTVDSIEDVAWLPDGRLAILSCLPTESVIFCDGNEVWLWEPGSDTMSKLLSISTRMGWSKLSIDPAGELLAIAGCLVRREGSAECTAGEVTVWEIGSGNQIGVVPLPARSVTFSPDGQALGIVIADGRATIISLEAIDRPD